MAKGYNSQISYRNKNTHTHTYRHSWMIANSWPFPMPLLWVPFHGGTQLLLVKMYSTDCKTMLTSLLFSFKFDDSISFFSLFLLVSPSFFLSCITNLNNSAFCELSKKADEKKAPPLNPRTYIYLYYNVDPTEGS